MKGNAGLSRLLAGVSSAPCKNWSLYCLWALGVRRFSISKEVLELLLFFLTKSILYKADNFMREEDL
jgi:hypothetical protein